MMSSKKYILFYCVLLMYVLIHQHRCITCFKTLFFFIQKKIYCIPLGNGSSVVNQQVYKKDNIQSLIIFFICKKLNTYTYGLMPKFLCTLSAET